MTYLVHIFYYYVHSDTKRAVILENVGCGGGCGGFSRNFRVDWNTWLGDYEGKDLLPAFFDLNDNVSYGSMLYL